MLPACCPMGQAGGDGGQQRCLLGRIALAVQPLSHGWTLAETGLAIWTHDADSRDSMR